MPDDRDIRLALREGSQLRTDIANLECGQELLMQQLARLPRPRICAARHADRVRRRRAWYRRDRGPLALLPGMQLDLTEEEAAALLSLLNRAIDDDRYPLSPRITMLRKIRN
jgi:hypothetical protein